jgi:hypothetical protein
VRLRAHRLAILENAIPVPPFHKTFVPFLGQLLDMQAIPPITAGRVQISKIAPPKISDDGPARSGKSNNDETL